MHIKMYTSAEGIYAGHHIYSLIRMVEKVQKGKKNYSWISTGIEVKPFLEVK